MAPRLRRSRDRLQWDRIRERGSLDSGKYAAAYEKSGKLLAVCCLGEDGLGLKLEVAMAAGDAGLVAQTFADD